MKGLTKRLGRGLALLCLMGSSNLYAQNCGLDLYIANDQSGSVDASENIASREFITKLSQAHMLGNNNSMNRIGLAEWDFGFFPYAFPSAGTNFSTNMADIIAYQQATRTVSGGTDVYGALFNAFLKTSQTPVAGRSVRKVILLMTDASNGQVSNNITDLANRIKNAGVSIVVMAIGDAANITILQTVASHPSLYFSAADYTALSSNVTATVNSVLTSTCNVPLPAPSWDLSVTNNSLDCAAGQVSYTVHNTADVDLTNQTISTSFYDGNPTLWGFKLLATDVKTGQTIAAHSSQTYTFTDASLQYRARVGSVVNLNTASGNTASPLPFDLSTRLNIAGEQNPYNNIGDVITGSGCSPDPVLDVSAQVVSIGCTKELTYQVKITNRGATAASNVIPQFFPGSTNLVLKSTAAQINSGKVLANMANPGTDLAATGYDGYQALALFPCAVEEIAPPCGGNFNFTNSGNRYVCNGVFAFPPVVSNSGVPAGSTILSARLTGRFPALGTVTGIKMPNVPRFDSSTNHPGVLWVANHTIDSVIGVGGGIGISSSIDVTNVAQELVNQPGWSENSTLAFMWRGAKLLIGSNVTSTFEISYLAPFTIAPGESATITYVYQDTSANGGTYHASAAVSNTTPNTTYLPNTNFTANSISGLNGYDGSLSANTADDAVVTASTGCTQTPQAITTSVSINPTTSCAGSGNYVTATVTIQNPNTEPLPSGITLRNITQELNLTGTGAKFIGEPYDITSGLQLAGPNIMDPAYPTVPNTINGKTGVQSLEIYQLPPGTSTFKIDIVAGTANLNLASTIKDIPVTYNPGGSSATAQDATGVTVGVPPTASINCPASVNASATTLNITGITTGTGGSTPVKWSSNTNGIFTANGTSSNAAPDYNYAITDIDRANGKVDIQLNVLSATGCEAVAYCTVPITGTQMDYGDLPASYDFNGDITPIAAGALNPTNNMKLGTLGAGPDALVKSSQKADGDGAEEDGVTAFNPITLGINSYSVDVNYTSDVAATVCGWFDWNNNGHFDAGEGVCNAVPAQVNGVTTLSWSNINGGNGPGGGMLGYSRFRISSDNMSVNSFFGPTTNGEVEDYNVLAVALPLNLLKFEAQKTEGNALLSWVTADEVNTAYFEVEASTNGTLYEAIGRVKAAGNSEAQQQYSFVHQQPAAGRYYYRLKMADKDGEIRYSGTRILHFGSTETIALQPNPARQQVSISGIPANSRIHLLDATGRVVLQLVAQATATTLSIANLAPGHYQVRISNPDGAIIGSTKLVKQ